MSGDPASWLVIERGWVVTAGDGSQVGRVEEVVGDEEKDIFNGVAVRTGFFTTRYVPSERVRDIRYGRVELDLDADEMERLEPYG